MSGLNCKDDALLQEFPNVSGNFAVMAFQSKVAAVHKLHYCVRQVTFEGLGSGRNEGRVILAPDGKESGLMFTEILLNSG